MKLPIVNRFLVLSFLCILALAVGMGAVLSSLLTRAALQWEWENTAALARHETRQVNLEAFFSAPSTPETRERWRASFSGLFIGMPEVVRVKVWDRNATVVWSDDERLIGQRFSDDEELREALAGRVTVEIKDLAKRENLYERAAFHTLAEIYVPLFSKKTGQVVGVVELYKTPIRLWATLRWGRIIIWTISLAGGVALYLVLLPLVRQVYGREVREATFRAYAGGLENEVAGRTRELQKQTARLTQLNALAHTVTASLDTQRVFEAVVQGALELLHVALACLWVIEPSTGDSVLVASASAPERPMNSEDPTRFSKGQGLAGWVIEHRRASDCTVGVEDPDLQFTDWVKREGLASWLAVPLLRGNQVLGALVVLTRERREFSQEGQELLGVFAAEAALAIENARLYEETQHRLRHTETLLAVSQAIGSTLELPEVARRTTREMVRALGGDMGGALHLNPTGDQLIPLAGYRVPKELLETLSRTPILMTNPLTEEAKQYKGPIYSSDSQSDPRFDSPLARLIPHKSILVAPMWLKDEIVGGFAVIWTRARHHFTPEELRLVEGISRQAALAVENARLYDQHTGMVEQLRLFHHAIRAIGEAVTILDLEGRIIFVNEAFKRMYRWSEAEALGTRPESDASRFNQPEIMNQIHAETLRGGWQGELRSRRKTGEEFPIFLTTAPVLDEAGNPVAMVGVSRELTQLKLLQAQLVQAEKLAATGQLAAGVAHEINNPLSVILGLASLALQKSPPKAMADDLDTIRAETLRAAKIIRDLLAFARPTPHERLPVDLNDLLRQTLALQAYHLATDQIEVIWKLTEPLPKTLADRGQLQQVIMNLVLNAHQAMKAAHGRGTLWIETGSDGDQVWAQFRDNGPGIPPEVLPRIFDPFLTTKPVGQGTGLGLSVSYGIAQAHGGQLLVDSTLGQGATFTLRLLVVEPPARALASPPSPTPAPTRSLSVLVVDDEPAVARLLALMLEQLGHRPTVVHSGREALDRLAHGVFELMTLDLRMPQMGGQEVWHHLQGLPRCPRVLFVTGDLISDEVRSFLATSGRPYLEKPFQLGDLSRKINDLDL